MNTLISISDHPRSSDFKRKIQLQPLTIDYAEQVANWPFQVVHYNLEGDELFDIIRANGNFRLSDERVVNPANGIRLPIGETEMPAETEGGTPVAGVGEFQFLRGMLMQPNVDPLVLVEVRIDSVDSQGNFDNYGNLMRL
jgi:hypothetical protein